MKELKKIPADKIERQDDRFIYRSGSPRNEWALPAFLEENGRYIPVSELHEPKGPEVDAYVYAQESDIEDMLLDTLRYRELSVFDIARSLKILERQVASLDKKTWSRTLGIAVDKWDGIKGLIDFDPLWQNYFIDKKAPLKRILPFGEKGLRTTLKPLLDLNPGINVLASIAGLISAVSHRDKKDIAMIWDELHLDTILETEALSSPEKLKEIRDTLFECRYPTIAAYRKELNEHIRSIPRAARVDLHSDENFETPGMILQADLRSRQDIETLQEWLDKQKDELEKIIDIQKGNEGK